jgi:hypothetical protein
MSNDKIQSKTKTVYVDGMAIGEVPATGDLEKDFDVALQYVKEKGFYKQTTMAQAMFRQAVSFATTGAHLYEQDLKGMPRSVFSIAPFVVNCAFAIELYLKTLAQIHGKSLKGHKLVELFDGLPDSARKAIEIVMPDCAAKRRITEQVSFRDFLAELNDAFVEWRYCYELSNTGKVRIAAVIFIADCLHQACRNSSAELT